jgi:predicted nucleic acid-binding Zn ribbon protein
MQRTARLLAKIKDGAAKLSSDELAVAVWPAAVGKRLANRTGPLKLYGAKLVVDVEDAVWQHQLTTLAPQILGKIKQIAGPGLIEALEFRVGAPRRLPHTAIDTEGDRADGITDPIFRLLYLASREKEDKQRMRISA